MERVNEMGRRKGTKRGICREKGGALLDLLYVHVHVCIVQFESSCYKEV